MFNRSTLSFALGLGIPAALFTVLLALRGYNGPLAAVGIYATLILAAATLISLKSISSFRSRFEMSLGAALIWGLAQYAVQEYRHWDGSSPFWLFAVRAVVFLAIPALLALAIAAISRPWQTAATA